MGLEKHRQEVELIDERIIRLIDQRVHMAKKILEDKKAESKAIKDPEREKLVLERAMYLATELNLDTGAIKEIFQILIRMSLQKQQNLIGRGDV